MFFGFKRLTIHPFSRKRFFFFATMPQRSRKTGKTWKISKLKTPVYYGEGGKTPPFGPTLVPTVVASFFVFKHLKYLHVLNMFKH